MRSRSQRGALRLEVDGVGAAIEDKKLLVAVCIANRGRDPARDMQLTLIDLQHAALLKPAALPLRLGTIAGGKDALLQLVFRRERLVEGREYRLVIHGRSGTHNFELRCAVTPPVSEGERRARRATAPVKRIKGSAGAAGPPPQRLGREDEEKQPPLPRGEFVGAPGPHGRPIEVRHHAGPEFPNYGGPGNPAPNPGIAFIRAGSTLVGPPTLPGNGKGPKDSTGASVDLPAKGGGVTPLVVLSGNFYEQFSVDGGSTFTNLGNPNTIFPQSSFPLDGLPQDLGLQSDYNLIYIPSVDRIVWQLLTAGSVIPSDPEHNHWNRLRVAFTSPQEFVDSGGKSWSYWDMTTATFGLNNEVAFLDYPDVHYTAKALYFTVTDTDGWRLLVIQVPLSDLQGSGTIHIGFTNVDDGQGAAGARLVHYSPDAGYWARHGPKSNQLTVYEWPDGSDTYSWRWVKIDTWYDDENEEDFASYTPDGTNWLYHHSTAVRGGTVQRDFKDKEGDIRRIVFAWSAPRTKAVPQPHVRIQPILRKTASGTTKWSSEPSTDMWHPDFAFNHVSLASNSKGEVGVSVGAGGGGTKSGGSGSDATPVAGFLGDNTLYSIGVSTASADPYGDYSAVRRHWPDERYFSVFDYYTLAAKPNGSARAQYRMFARPDDL